MKRNLVGAAAAVVIALALDAAAIAAADDYAFEPVNVEVKKGDDAVVSVRLRNKATGQPVSGAVIVRSRIDMAPEGMAEMAPLLEPVPSSEPGVYSFKTELSMAGQWLLSIAAKVQGEPETVVGKVTFRAIR
jgi:hypothetical protein